MYSLVSLIEFDGDDSLFPLHRLPRQARPAWKGNSGLALRCTIPGMKPVGGLLLGFALLAAACSASTPPNTASTPTLGPVRTSVATAAAPSPAAQTGATATAIASADLPLQSG